MRGATTVHGWLARHLPREAATAVAVLYYALLMAGIALAYQRVVGGFVYLGL